MDSQNRIEFLFYLLGLVSLGHFVRVRFVVNVHSWAVSSGCSLIFFFF